MLMLLSLMRLIVISGIFYIAANNMIKIKQIFILQM